jgi:spermidine synthase
MELWYTEHHTDYVKFSMKVKEQLVSRQSDFQHIAILDTEEFGRILTLDGYLMVTEKDEFIYHDMIVHVPMATNLDIKKVLVIGAGDGGSIRELTRYQSIEQIDMVEIDSMVVDV